MDSPIRHPVFLIGSERSGTTLLRLMLDHHPDIAFNLESEFLVSHISDAGVFPEVAAYRKGLAEDRVFRHSRFTVGERLGFAALAHDFLRQKRDRDGKRIVGATVHYGFGRLKFLWPEARYIYVLRDGRDVASSVVGMGWAGNEYIASKWWLEAEAEWNALRATLDPSRWIEIRYEDLTADTHGQLRRLCDFIGVAFSERMLDYVKSSTYERPDPRQNFKWRRAMPARRVRLVEARIGAQLAARGYALSGEPSLGVGPMHRKWLQLHSRLASLSHRLATYGPQLVIADLAARHLGWLRLQSTTRRAMDLIVDRNVE
jgi:hypothetical protein